MRAACLTLLVLLPGCIFPWDERHQSPMAPNVAFDLDEALDRLVVQAAASTADWSEFHARANQTLRTRVNDDAPRDLARDTWTMLAPTASTIMAGETLTLCQPETRVEHVELQLMHAPTNTLVYASTIQSVERC